MISDVALTGLASSGSEAGLSKAQDESLMAVLSNYDSKNLSAEDARDIVSGIRDIGIKAGGGLADALVSSGFSAREIAEKSGVFGQSQERKAASSEMTNIMQTETQASQSQSDVDGEALTTLTKLIEKYEGQDLSEDDWSDLYQSLQEERIDASKPLLDLLL